MADKTKIEWTDATWNPITGCAVVSPGCTNCYAMKLAGTRLQHHESRSGLTKMTKAGPVWNGQVRLNRQWLHQPSDWKRPRMIFVCAHGDLFAEQVPDDWILDVLTVIACNPQHQFQVLTKRADRMRDFMCRPDLLESIYANWFGFSGAPREVWSWPLHNLWLGVSVEDQVRANERIPQLLETPAAIRWISAEPLLGPVDLTRLSDVRRPLMQLNALRAYYSLGPSTMDASSRLDWVVAGGESGRDARPMHPDWARGLRDQCQAEGIAFLFKQWGSCLPGDMSGEDGRGGPGYIVEDEHLGVDHDSLGRGLEIFAHGREFIRFSHARTGRRLDGAEHDAFPKITTVEELLHV